MKKLIVYIFAFIGLFACSVVLFLAIYLFTQNKTHSANKSSCLDGPIAILDTQYINGEWYMVIYNLSGFSDKVEFVLLYKTDDPYTTACFESSKVVSRDVLDFKADNKPRTEWPIEILIQNNELTIKSTTDKNKSVGIFNVDIKWDK